MRVLHWLDVELKFKLVSLMIAKSTTKFSCRFSFLNVISTFMIAKPTTKFTSRLSFLNEISTLVKFMIAKPTTYLTVGFCCLDLPIN